MKMAARSKLFQRLGGRLNRANILHASCRAWLGAGGIFVPSPISAEGHKRKSAITFVMSVKPPKAEVSLSRFDVR